VNRPRSIFTVSALLVLLVAGASCGVPVGEPTFDEIDGEVLGGLNDPTTTTTSTTSTTTTSTTVPDAAPETTALPTTTDAAPSTATASIYFISRGSLSPITLEVDAAAGLNELIVLLEDGPPNDVLGQRLQSFVEPGLIVGAPVTESGVIQVELDGTAFDEITSSNQQRQAVAQIVVTLLQNTPAVGQVSFTIDDQIILIPADGGSKELLSVDDFTTLGVPRSSNEPPDDVDPVDIDPPLGPTTSVAQ